MLKGRIRNIIANRNYGWIIVMDEKRDSRDYFFHRDDYNGDWGELEREVLTPHAHVWVEFEPLETPRGVRASNVKRVDSVI